ncbi:serine hydrolase domain-containing protein [Pseudomonas sp. CGJS7]|uniref:serine hydrolase domain-containing protein n=1 Tax=Pseudomonas sp. CGJS7 TaxID=3109348 RepID=UPI00300A465D
MRSILLCALAALTAPLLASAAPADTARALETIRQHAAAAHSDAVLIQRGDKTLLDTSTAQGAKPIEMMSATKSVVALAIGFLIQDGKLRSIDEPVSAIYPEWAQGKKRGITVRMLLDHTSGLQNVPNAGAELEPAPDLVKIALAAELDNPPGTTFSYNNKATNLLSGIVQTLSGQPMDRYLETKLFAPLGITEFSWLKDKAGQATGMAGLSLRAHDIAKIGRLLLNDGVAPDGRRLLSREYVGLLTAPSQHSPEVGLLWWRIPAWERYTLRADAAAILDGKGLAADMRAAFLSTAGQNFASRAEVLAYVAGKIGPSWQERFGPEVIGKGVKLAELFDIERGPIEGYAANGYLGQFLLIVPGKDLVAVRQIRRTDQHVSPRDDYPDFFRDVLALGKTL